MNYSIREFKDNVVVVDYDDSSWAEVPVYDGMTPSDVDKAVEAFKPKPIVSGNVLLDMVGTTRQVAEINTATETPAELDARTLEQARMFKADVVEILKEFNLV